jgi:hypothetical protein
MPGLNETVASLYGALRLARFDPRGLTCFNATLAGFWRSFFAALLVAPLYAIELWAPFEGAGAPRTVTFALVEAIAYAVSWLAYPVAVETLARAMGCRQRFLVYMTAYNWSAVIQHLIIASIALLTSIGVLPSPIGQVVWLAATIYLLAYAWFIARTGLAIGPWAASGLVVLSLSLDILIASVASAIEATLTQIPAAQ